MCSSQKIRENQQISTAFGGREQTVEQLACHCRSFTKFCAGMGLLLRPPENVTVASNPDRSFGGFLKDQHLAWRRSVWAPNFWMHWAACASTIVEAPLALDFTRKRQGAALQTVLREGSPGRRRRQKTGTACSSRPLKYLTNGRIPAGGLAWRCSSSAQFSGNLPNSGSIRTPAGGRGGDFHGFRPRHAACGRNAARERSRVRL